MSLLSKISSLLTLLILMGCSSQVNLPEIDDSSDQLTDNLVFHINLESSSQGNNTKSAWEDSSDLLDFPREVNHLWYAIYNEKELIYSSEEENATQAVHTDNEFYLSVVLPKKYNTSNLSVFFCAGNSENKVRFEENLLNPLNCINLDFKNKVVSVDHLYINFKPQISQPSRYEYDYKSFFMGYVQELGNFREVEKVTLKQPFLQLHCLTDEFNLIPELRSQKWLTGFSKIEVLGTFSEYYNNYPEIITSWFYEDSKMNNTTYHRNHCIFSPFTNYYRFSIDNMHPSIQFDSREMDYVLYANLFFPTDQLIKDNYNFLSIFQGSSDNLFFPIDNRMKPTSKYIIYNKPSDTVNAHKEGLFIHTLSSIGVDANTVGYNIKQVNL